MDLKSYTIILIVLSIILSMVFLTSCQKEVTCNYPYVKKGFECCLDSNQNNICDDEEEEEIDIVESVETIEGYCGDKICQKDENSCICSRDCGICQGEVGVCEKYECINNSCTKTTIRECCGNNICETSESCQTCKADCGECGNFVLKLRQIVSEDDSEIFNEQGNLIYAAITLNKKDYTPAELEEIMPGFSYILLVDKDSYSLSLGKTGRGLVYECTRCLEEIYDGTHKVTLRAERLPVKAEDTIDVNFDRLS